MARMPERLTDPESERAVLGSMLIDPNATAIAADFVGPDDFNDEGHQLLFKTAYDLHHGGSAVDYLTLSSALGDKLRRIGNGSARAEAYLTKLINDTPNAYNVPHYARIVRNLSTLRSMVAAAGQIAKLAYNADGHELDALWDRARRLLDASAPASSDEFLLLWMDSFNAYLEQQLDRCSEIDAQNAGEIKPRATFPWKALRNKPLEVKYARPGTLIGVIAPPGVGKTVFAECCAEHWAEEGLQVVFFHLELGQRAMLDRRMCRQSGVALSLIEDGYIDGTTSDASYKMQSWPGAIHYVHCPGWSAARIVRLATKLHDRGQCDALIVDYLQKMRRDYSRGLNPAQALGWSIELLKNCGEDLGLPVVLPAQLNVTGKKEKIKTGVNVRDTGELEDKANLVITLDRPLLLVDVLDDQGKVVAKAGQRSPIVRGRVDKNTFGACGPFKMMFLGERFLFTDNAKQQEPPPLNF